MSSRDWRFSGASKRPSNNFLALSSRALIANGPSRAFGITTLKISSVHHFVVDFSKHATQKTYKRLNGISSMHDHQKTLPWNCCGKGFHDTLKSYKLVFDDRINKNWIFKKFELYEKFQNQNLSAKSSIIRSSMIKSKAASNL